MVRHLYCSSRCYSLKKVWRNTEKVENVEKTDPLDKWRHLRLKEHELRNWAVKRALFGKPYSPRNFSLLKPLASAWSSSRKITTPLSGLLHTEEDKDKKKKRKQKTSVSYNSSSNTKIEMFYRQPRRIRLSFLNHIKKLGLQLCNCVTR